MSCASRRGENEPETGVRRGGVDMLLRSEDDTGERMPTRGATLAAIEVRQKEQP
jgi:hypothetical protein